MTREEALKQLGAEGSYQRLRAARFLEQGALPEDIPFLLSARRNEADHYVRKSLGSALLRARARESRAAEPANGLGADTDVEADRERVRREATTELAGVFLHEIEKLVGHLAYDLRTEVPGFSSLRSSGSLERLRDAIEGLEQVRDAGRPARISEFDLADQLRQVSGEIADSRRPVLQGPARCIVRGDQRLFKLVVRNALSNALEAVEKVHDAGPIPVLVTWGQSDRENWVSVLDSGVGLQIPEARAFQLGQSTKGSSRGFGLAISKRAAEGFGGIVSLEAQKEGGTKFEIRWPR